MSGTLAGPRHQPRLIGAMGFDMDVMPERHMLFIRNEDVPGMIGKVGTTLGEYGINIGKHGRRPRRARLPRGHGPSPWTSLYLKR